MAKEGYYGGDPEKVLEGRVDMVLLTAQYDVFQYEYQEEEFLLNNGGGR